MTTVMEPSTPKADAPEADTSRGQLGKGEGDEPLAAPPNALGAATRHFARLVARSIAFAVAAYDRVTSPTSPANPRRLGRAIGIILVTAIGMAIGQLALGDSTSSLGPFQFKFHLQLAPSGGSVVHLTPFGTLQFDSHQGPLQFVAHLTDADPEQFYAFIREPSQVDALFRNTPLRLGEEAIVLALKSAAAAILGATVLSSVVYRRRKQVGLAALLSFVITAQSVGIAAATFNSRAIEETRLSGLLADLPGTVIEVEEAAIEYDQFRAELVDLFGAIGSLPERVTLEPTYEVDENYIRVLHVSDLRTSTTVWSAISAAVDGFDVDVVLDTGNISEFGSGPEATYYVNAIGELDVPYVYVSGSNDSAGIRMAVAAQPNAIVLDNEAAVVSGLRIAGIGSPLSEIDRGSDSPPDAAEAGRGLAETIDEINQDSGSYVVDVAIVHEPSSAYELAESVPLVLAGNEEERKVQNLDDDTLLMVQAGTSTGGILSAESFDQQFHISILYFEPEEGRLHAYDDVVIDPSGEYSIQFERFVLP